MAAASVETPEIEPRPTARDRAVDACRQAAHVSHEARLLKSVAEDAIEDGVHAAKRAIKSAQRRVGDLKDEATYRVKRRPLQAMGAAFGIGLVLGLATGWIAHRAGQHD